MTLREDAAPQQANTQPQPTTSPVPPKPTPKQKVLKPKPLSVSDDDRKSHDFTHGKAPEAKQQKQSGGISADDAKAHSFTHGNPQPKQPKPQKPAAPTPTPKPVKTAAPKKAAPTPDKHPILHKVARVAGHAAVGVAKGVGHAAVKTAGYAFKAGFPQLYNVLHHHHSEKEFEHYKAEHERQTKVLDKHREKMKKDLDKTQRKKKLKEDLVMSAGLEQPAEFAKAFEDMMSELLTEKLAAKKHHIGEALYTIKFRYPGKEGKIVYQTVDAPTQEEAEAIARKRAPYGVQIEK